jgi:hypothetical protein
VSTLLTFDPPSLPFDCSPKDAATLVFAPVSAVKVVVVTIGVGVGEGVGVGVGVGVGFGVGAGVVGVVEPELDPLAEVVVAPDEVSLFEAAPPQPVTSANPSRAQNRVPNREIWTKISPPRKRRE